MNSQNLRQLNSLPDHLTWQDFSWADIDHIFLDLDGTLLDKYFDDHFWEEYVPTVYSRKYGVSFQQAREQLLATYKSVENTLQWTDLNYWSNKLGLDMGALKMEVSHFINIHPHVLDFFSLLDSINKKFYLITNAHPIAMEVKLARVNISARFERIICSQDVGAAKEQIEFWQGLQKFITYDPKRTLFVDDTEKVLDTAKEYGITHLIHIAKPSSKLPAKKSNYHPSILNFRELHKIPKEKKS